jgi:hypothetical protein
MSSVSSKDEQPGSTDCPCHELKRVVLCPAPLPSLQVPFCLSVCLSLGLSLPHSAISFLTLTHTLTHAWLLSLSLTLGYSHSHARCQPPAEEMNPPIFHHIRHKI